MRLIHKILFSLIVMLVPICATAQNMYEKNNIDSAAINKKVRQEYKTLDSIKQAMNQKRIADSTARALEKIKMQAYRDSLAQARIEKRKKDSIDREIAKQKIIDERRKKDSIETARRKFVKDSMEAVFARQDSIRKAELRIRDSMETARLKTLDSIAKIKKAQADSLKYARQEEQRKREEWQKYTQSQHYKDSVEARKKALKDSLEEERYAKLLKERNERDRINDSIKNKLKKEMDSIAAIRKRINDSTKLAVQQQNETLKQERDRVKDSLTAAREKRTDSLKLIREKNEKIAKEREEINKEKKKLALAVKMHQDKQKEWSNEKLLKRKWNIPRKIYQNTVTRYNYYYHARKKYNEAIKRVANNNKEDYTKNIAIKAGNIEKNGSTIASDMDTVIKKASFSTQIHDPRSKWFDDLYLLMGKASYAKGDYEGAITTFQFIVNEYKINKKNSTVKKDPKQPMSLATQENKKGIHKLSHHPIRNQALIWLAKSYIMAEQYSEAQSLLAILQKDPFLPKEYKSEVMLTKASLNITQNNETDAIESLELALKQPMKEKQKLRTEFLLGQLYANANQYAKSSEHFKKSLGKKNNPEMDFYTKLYLATNAAKGGGDKDFAKSELLKIINDAKYEKFKSEALNALAAIEAQEDIAKAADYLKKSIKNPENKDKKQKAIAFASLGDIYYKLSEYELAKTSYDSAYHYGNSPPVDNLEHITTRKNVLTEIVSYLRTIKMQDSMLVLAKKSEKEQKAAAKRELERMQKEDEAKKEVEQPKAVALQPQGMIKSNWYFYNAAMVQKGGNEFKQKWGNRKLEDNWRRASVTMNFNAVANNEDTADAELNVRGTNIQQLLAQLPKTPAQADAANMKIQDAYYNLGLAYYSQLDDYYNAIKTFETLLEKYPATKHKQPTYYALYLNHDKLNQKQQAQKYKNLLMEEFGQTEFSMLANNPSYKEESKNKSKNIYEHYDNTYLAYKQGKYKEALDRVQYAKNAYKEHPIQAKYALVEAVSEAGLKDLPKCKMILQDIISKYPNSDEQVRAQEILNAIAIKGDSSDINNAPIEIINPNMNKYDDSLEASKAFAELRLNDGKGVFVYEPAEIHYVLIFIKNVDGRTMALKAALSDYNLLKNNLQEYTTNLNLLTAQQGVITIQKFANNIFAKKYMNELAKENNIFTQLKKNEFELAIISTGNFNELLKSRDILGYLRFFKKQYK